MKSIARTLPVLGLLLAFSSPALALEPAGDAPVYQQDKCKADEKWDETQGKCVKR